MNANEIGQTVNKFISKNFLFDESRKVPEADSLLGSGIIDSTGVLELIAFLEQEYKVKFEDQELVAENFDSINNIKSFISRKIS
jgi:acyl carrier protein